MTNDALARIAVTDRIWHGAADYPRGLSGWQGRSTAALAVAAWAAASDAAWAAASDAAWDAETAWQASRFRELLFRTGNRR